LIALVPIPERIRKSRRSAEGGLIFAEQVRKLDEPRARRRPTRQRKSGGLVQGRGPAVEDQAKQGIVGDAEEVFPLPRPQIRTKLMMALERNAYHVPIA